MNGKAELQQIKITQLQRGRYQTRKVFAEEAIQELAASIKEQGLVQPLVVCQLKEDLYEIVAGERRWRAAKKIKLATVPCLVKKYTDPQIAAVTTIENLQREDLNAVEEAQAFLRMAQDFSYSHEEISLLVGKSRVYVTNSLRLLKLELRVQQYLIKGDLQVGHAKVLAGIAKIDQYSWAKKCIQEQWSVRQLEQALSKVQTPQLPQAKSIEMRQTVDLRRLESVLAEQVGAEVKLELAENKTSGWFKVKFYDADTLSGLLNKMGLEEELQE